MSTTVSSAVIPNNPENPNVTIENENISQMFDPDEGSIRLLGMYIYSRSSSLSNSDLALYKTRKNRAYCQLTEIILGPEFNDTTLDMLLDKIEQEFPNISSIVDREGRINSIDTIRNNYLRQNISGSVIEHSSTGMLCLKFRGRLVDLYAILNTDYIYDLAYSLTTYYFQNMAPPKKEDVHMTREEYNQIIKRRVARKKDESQYCCLSMENFKKGQTIAETPCGHVFKSSHLRTWLTRECVEPTCPLCRANLLHSHNETSHPQINTTVIV